MIGMRSFWNATLTFLFTPSSVSPNISRRSEWPRITYLQRSALSIWADTSPVYAPLASQCMFCAPRANSSRSDSMRVCTVRNDVAGGQTAISTC
jgi:hypothetical protein